MFPRHDGSTLAAGLAFPIAPSPAIGDVLSADTNVPAGDGAFGRFFRGMGSGSVATYVGREGFQRWTQGSFGAPTEVVVRFTDVDRLSVGRTRISRAGSYAITKASIAFLRAPAKEDAYSEGDDEPIARFEAEHYDPKAEAVPQDATVQFFQATERAWNAWITPRLLAELARTGVVVFRSSRGYMVRVAKHELAAGYPGGVMRSLARRDVHRLDIHNGRVLVTPALGGSPEVAGIELGNFGALIPVLEAAGYPL